MHILYISYTPPIHILYISYAYPIQLLVGNKVDQTRVVQRERAEEWAKSQGMLFMEASAKTKEGIAQVFIEVVTKVLENPNLLLNTRPAKPGSGRIAGSTNNRNNSSSSSGGCC